jgi:hypothetical protein
MSQYLNKSKNNNNKFDKSPENFQINMNNINNLGNFIYAKDHKKSQNEKKPKMPNQKKLKKKPK